MATRLRKAEINAFINAHGRYVKLAIELGVARINTIKRFPPAAQAYDFEGRSHRGCGTWRS